MRVAYTLNGLIGGLSGKNSSRTNEDDMPYIIDYVYCFFDKNILPYNTSVDFFIFSYLGSITAKTLTFIINILFLS